MLLRYTYYIHYNPFELHECKVFPCRFQLFHIKMLGETTSSTTLICIYVISALFDDSQCLLYVNVIAKVESWCIGSSIELNNSIRIFLFLCCCCCINPLTHQPTAHAQAHLHNLMVFSFSTFILLLLLLHSSVSIFVHHQN